MRSRQKRKCWVSNLEAKLMAVNNTNKLLQSEVVTLRSELAQLKLQLLAHKDCSVTLALLQQPRESRKNSLQHPNDFYLNLFHPKEISREKHRKNCNNLKEFPDSIIIRYVLN